MAQTASSVAAAASRAILNRAVASPIEIRTIIGIATQAKYRTRKPTPTMTASAPPTRIGAMANAARRTTARRASDAVAAAYTRTSVAPPTASAHGSMERTPADDD